MDIYSVLRFDASEASDSLVSYQALVLGNLYESIKADSTIGFDFFMSSLIEQADYILTDQQVGFVKAFFGYCPIPRAWVFATNLLDGILTGRVTATAGLPPWALRVLDDLRWHRHTREAVISHVLRYRQIPSHLLGQVSILTLPVPSDRSDLAMSESSFTNGAVSLTLSLPDRTTFRVF